MAKRKFTKEFKEEAVKLALRGDRTKTDIAKSLGVEVWHISYWVKEYLKAQGNAFPGNGRKMVIDPEKEALKKQIADLKMENEILKKATAIFSRQK